MTTRNRETSAEWAATIPDDVTASVAKERLQYAYDYSSDAINAVMSSLSGTKPPAQALMPDLYAARKNVENGLTAIGALAERTPEARVSDTYVKLGRQVGVKLIDESNAAMDRVKQSESPGEMVRDVVQSVEHVAETAAKGVIRVAGLALTPMEAIFGAVLIDEIFNKGLLRKRILKG